jgi:hypothetical protein
MVGEDSIESPSDSSSDGDSTTLGDDNVWMDAGERWGPAGLLKSLAAELLRNLMCGRPVGVLGIPPVVDSGK